MNEETVKPTFRKFTEQDAERIQNAYGLTSYSVNTWRKRGKIPESYFTTACPITLSVGHIEGKRAVFKKETRTLHNWRNRLGLKGYDIAELLGVSKMIVSYYDRGLTPVKPETITQITEYLQTKLPV